MTVADSLIYPEVSDSTYPYTDTGDREFLAGKEFVETMVLCAHLFALTSTLRLTPFVLKLPVRPPVLVAKQASSLACLSGNRLGPGRRALPVAGGLHRDGRGVGAPRQADGRVPRHRARPDLRRVLRLRGGVLLDRVDASSARRPGEPVPLLVGGHADGALRRAVRKGDGWMHAGGDGEELDRLLARLAEIRREEGDTRDDFEVHVISYDAYDLDGIKRLEDKGVTDCIVGFRVPYIKGPDTEPLETKIEHLEQYAENIISKVGA